MMKGYRDKVEGIIHRYHKNEGKMHDLVHGATGCHCEPVVQEIRVDEDEGCRVVTRVVLHQRLKKRKNG